MKRILSLIIVFGLLAISSPAQDKQWDKYVPKDKRKEALRKSIKMSGMGADLAGSRTLVYWITDLVARAVVSDEIDHERLSNDEAEKRFHNLRPADSYLFLMETYLRDSPLMRHSVKTISEPLAANETFLQRGDNNKQFVRATISDKDFDLTIGHLYGDVQQSYILHFPHGLSEGEPLIKSLDDRIEIQFTMARKKVVLDYKLKDLVTKLEDL